MCCSTIENDNFYRTITRNNIYKLYSSLVVSIRQTKYHILIDNK